MSLVIFSIGLIALVGLAGKSMSQASQSRARNDASYLAGELIGEMWVSASAPNSFDLTPWQTRVASTIPGGNGTATVTVVSATAPTSYQVDIAITWPDQKERDVSNATITHRYSTSTQISKN
ncbi:MAG: hypothetical protein EKK46_04475 [Rhodocyclaceae bacterium]|nr:MAG: hypothetical protein EKK46_04475 [Rhodocyclaceae bacterium]